MQIHDVSANIIVRSYVRQSAGAAVAVRQESAIRQPNGRPRTDSLDLSSATRLLREAEAAVNGQSEIRMERVAALRATLTEGNYHIDYETLAARLLREAGAR